MRNQAEPGQKEQSHTFVDVPGAQVQVGDQFQLASVVLVELLDVALLVTDHLVQELDLRFQGGHLPLT